jgi:hypothetical protein
MPNEILLAEVMGPVYLVLGLSVLIYVKQWRHALEKWENNHLDLFTLMLMCGIMGAIVINMYNVWEWDTYLLVTLTGWALFVKSVFFLLMPGSLIKKVLAIKKSTPMLVLGGLLGVVIGGVLTYYSYFAQI